MKHIFRLSGSLVKGAAVLASAILLCTLSAHADELQSPEAIADSLTLELANATTLTDSLGLMLDIYDLAPEKDTLMHIRRIYNAAKKAGNRDDIRFDMLRQWFNFGIKWNDQGVIDNALKEFEQMPECEDKRQTRVFIDVVFAETRKYKSDAERLNYLRQLLRECADMPDDADPYERVTKHFVLIHLLRKETKGDLLSKYTTNLSRALDELPPIYHSYLRSKFDLRAANTYWNNDEYIRSIKCDRNLLLQYKRLEKYHRQTQGRKYRNYELNTYHALRRILRNYEILSEKEIRDYHDQVLQLAAKNPKVAKAYASDPTADLGVMDLDGRYDEAIPMLQQLVKNASSAYDRRMYLRFLVKFADKAGNIPVKIEAERQTAEFLDTYINRSKSAERVRELELLYEVNNLRRLNAKGQLEREQKKNNLLYGMGAVILILLAVFIGLYGHSRRSRRAYIAEINTLKSDLAAMANCRDELKDLRTKMRKSESEKIQMLAFLGHELTTPLNAIINYSRLIVENIPDDSRDYLHHFASIIEVNSDILREIAKDLTEYGMNEDERVTLSKIPVDVNTLAEVTIESIKPQLKDGVTVAAIPGNSPGAIVGTDPRRVQIVLLSCISNMALLTEKGSITLETHVDRQKAVCTFAITAYGKNIPKEEAEKVFATWKKFEKDAKIDGLGLPNCQVIISALHATLTLDPGYTNGTRLLFSIPTK